MEDFSSESRSISTESISGVRNYSSNSTDLKSLDDMLKHTRTMSNNSMKNRPNISGDSITEDAVSTPETILLPRRFVVKYLGARETSSLWGIKYTRDPVDTLVAEAKQMLSTSSEKTLSLLKLEVSETGITVEAMPQNSNPNFPVGTFPIESISYGVQDLVYTRVFAMITVNPETTKDSQSIRLSELSKFGNGGSPYRCHAFVTDTRDTAKNLTLALAAAFQKFSFKVAAGKVKVPKNKQFAIELRSKDTERGQDSSEA